MSDVSKVGLWLLHNSIYRVILLMSEVSKVHGELSIQSNVTHVEGVESSSIYTLRAVMLCMSKVSKETQNCLTIFTHYFLNIQWIFNPKKVLES